MKSKLLFILLGVSLFAFGQEKDVRYMNVPCFVSCLQPGYVSAEHTVQPVRIKSRSLDKGLFGGNAGSTRMYCDITLPTLSSDLLVDVGMAMSRMPGVLAMAPRWFSMFSPTACPAYELYGSQKCQTAIMLTMRTYF